MDRRFNFPLYVIEYGLSDYLPKPAVKHSNHSGPDFQPLSISLRFGARNLAAITFYLSLESLFLRPEAPHEFLAHGDVGEGLKHALETGVDIAKLDGASRPVSRST